MNKIIKSILTISYISLLILVFIEPFKSVEQITLTPPEGELIYRIVGITPDNKSVIYFPSIPLDQYPEGTKWYAVSIRGNGTSDEAINVQEKTK